MEASVGTEKGARVNFGITKDEASSPEYSFEFIFPKGTELALKSVAITNGLPQLIFDASLKVPTITEEDVAIICKLVSEGKRPDFGFYPILGMHPFCGRQYNGYDPPLLRGTSVGKLLFEADWKMKCLHVGTKSDEKKSVFSSWKKSSNLKGLASWTDFPVDAKPAGSRIFMSCESVKVYRAEDGKSLEFVENPVITITDESNSLYSKYISSIFPNIAYHDEPLFLKMQELSKLILACEWLINEKGVSFNQRWMSKYYGETLSQVKSKDSSPAAAIEDKQHLPCAQKTKKLPYDMIPKPTVVQVPSDDVAVQTWEAQQYEFLSKCGVNYLHGYLDGGELVLYTDDGELVTRKQCLKTFVKKTTTIGGQKVGELMMWMNFSNSLPELSSLEPATMKNINDESDKPLPAKSTQGITQEDGSFGLITTRTKIDEATVTESSFQQTKTTTVPLLPVQETLSMKATVGNDYDMLYSDFIPPKKIPIAPGIESDLDSWSELYHETVPWPQRFQVPYTGIGEAAPSGGVSTHDLREVPTSRPRQTPVPQETRSETVGQYNVRNGHVTVQGMRQPSLATIRFANPDELARVSKKFRQDWTKGPSPNVEYVFVVSNSERERKWAAYRQGLRVNYKDETSYYHGTTLGCNILNSQQLCRYSNCGVCGISSIGLDKNYIRQKVEFQRFGPGFYLAPNSSKCHDYTEGNHESGYRAMLLCRVLPGRKYHLTKTDQRMQGPPPGYNSIYGQIGRDLNYPEIVISNPDAVIAQYIILYRKDGVDHPLSA